MQILPLRSAQGQNESAFQESGAMDESRLFIVGTPSAV